MTRPVERRSDQTHRMTGVPMNHLPPFADRLTPSQVHLRILETTDLHVHIQPYDYYTDRPDPGLGLAHTATLIRRLRQQAANTLLFDNGDFLQGNPMGDYIAARGMSPGQSHPAIDAMNILGYDAGALGNHEFNYGLDFLLETIAGARFPMLSANIALRAGTGPRQDRMLVRPYLLLDRVLTDAAGLRHPIRIGVIGFLPPQVTTWDYKYLHNRAVTRDIVTAARAWVPEMREAGADLVVALSHSGIGPPNPADGAENASLALAGVPGIDVILTGHSHQVFPSPTMAATPGVDPVAGTLHGKPATMAGFWGSHVGVVDLALERGATGWRVAQSASAAPPIAARRADGTARALLPRDKAVLRAVAEAHAETLSYVRRPVGHSPRPLHSYFAQLADAPAIALVARAQRAFVQARLQGTALADLPVLSAAAPFKAGGRAGPLHYTDVPAGPLALRHVADLYIYPNLIRAIRLTGADLHLWLEQVAGQFNRITPGLPDQMLINPDFPSYNFDMVLGVTFQIDLTQPAHFHPSGAIANPAARRIVNLCRNGQPVRPDAHFILATNDYRAHGGGDFPGARGDSVVYESTRTNRDVLLRYLRDPGALQAPPEPGWSFCPMPGTDVLYDTGPGARAHLAECPLPATPLPDPAPGGFLRLRLAL